jgi:hypothetical protein
MLKSTIRNSLIISTLFAITTEYPGQAYSNQSSICATRPEVLIRDFYTLEVVGQLNQGECMDVVNDNQHADPTVRAQYITVRGGQSGRLRLVSKQFVVYARNQSPSASVAVDNGHVSICATRPEVLIRDFYTLEVVGQLNQGECMDVVPNTRHSDPTIRAQYITVRGGSGKLRLVSKKFVVYSNGDDC